ncbi:MAG: metallophosphoesterase [Fimbriimonadaceae bacterium]|nr:metallophosphoesterase [Fimbriimonadaceae bacterium]
MRVSRHWVWMALWLAGRLLAAPQLAATSGADPTILPAAAADAVAGLRLQPYLQEVSPTGFALRFETTTAAPLEVRLLSAQGQPLASVTEPAVRIHELVASGLSPATVYRWQVGPATTPWASGQVTTWARDPQTLRFMVYGDTRTRAEEHQKIADAMAARVTDHAFVVHTGDLVADGSKYEQWKPQFFDPAARLLAKLPLLAVAGNHERASDFYRSYFTAPDPEWYYSVRQGPVHLTMIDFYKSSWFGDHWRETPEGKWLLADLARAKAAPWRIACFHTPIYSLGPHGKLAEDGLPGEKPMRFCRQELFPLLIAAGYQLVFSGHDHIYERSQKDGLTMVTSGGGGAPTYLKGPAAQNPFSQVFASVTHWCEVAVTPTRLTLTALDGAGQEIDRVDLTK